MNILFKTCQYLANLIKTCQYSTMRVEKTGSFVCEVSASVMGQANVPDCALAILHEAQRLVYEK